MKPTTYLLAVGFALFTAHANAQVYKCVDAKGKTVYSQSPCPANSKSKTLEANPPPSAPAPASGAAKGPLDPRKADAEFKKRQLEEQAAAKKASEKDEEAKVKEENCGRAKGSLAQYEAGGRITRYNAKGEREFLNDDEIAREKARAQDMVQQYCK